VRGYGALRFISHRPVRPLGRVQKSGRHAPRPALRTVPAAASAAPPTSRAAGRAVQVGDAGRPRSRETGRGWKPGGRNAVLVPLAQVGFGRCAGPAADATSVTSSPVNSMWEAARDACRMRAVEPRRRPATSSSTSSKYLVLWPAGPRSRTVFAVQSGRTTPTRTAVLRWHATAFGQRRQGPGGSGPPRPIRVIRGEAAHGSPSGSRALISVEARSWGG